MSHLQRFWLVFGPFNTPLADEIAYCYECLDQGPKEYTNDFSKLDDSVYCRMMLECDKEPDPNFLEELTVAACNVLEAHIQSVENGEPRDPTLYFFLPANFFEEELPEI
ncbi:hypothetical protein BJX96DRAFT_179744 [Aspergillus floccosus]